jgi:hypothetical protein
MKILKFILFVLLSICTSYLFSQTKELSFTTKDDGSLRANGRRVITFSSLNQEEIMFNCVLSSLGSKQLYSLRLQYSLDNKKWEDVLDSRSRKIEFRTAKRAKNSSYKVKLPSECDNKDTIWLSWKSTRLKGKGRYPQINIKSIQILSQEDRFFGHSPEIKVRLKQEYTSKDVNELRFNHTPIPYTYPQTKRLIISGRFIREEIKLSLLGKDANYFKVDNNKLKIDSSGFGIIAINYAPLKVGSHSAQLSINTKKLGKPITINLYGSSDKMLSFDNNLISDSITQIKDNMQIDIPVFSEMDYHFQFSYLNSNISQSGVVIEYKWFRGSELILDMEDEIFINEDIDQETDSLLSSYCVPLTSPQYANSLQITFSTLNNVLDIENLYFGSPTLKRSVASGLWSDENIWEPKEVPVMEDFVYISPKHKIRVNDDVVCSMLILGDSSNVMIDASKMFYISGDIVYGRGSWFVVHQNLIPKRWNYVSSPVNNARALIYSMRKDDNETWLMRYNTGVKSKLKDYWSDYIVDPNYWLVPARGYAVYTNNPLDVIYEGILCDSKVNYQLEYSEEDSWNLVGNPFTAPLSSKKIFEDIDQKIQGNALFFLDSKNGVYNPIIIDGKEEVVLPSMEGFFVESLRENTEISFQRKHQYIPKSTSYHWSNHNYLTLTISKDNRSEYILMGMDDNSKYGFDNYDAHKLFGSSEDMPELYFKIGKEELAVNVFPSYPASFDLCYYIGKESDLSLSIGNLSVLPMSIILFLEDKQEKKFYNLCTESQIEFNAKKGSTEDRFKLHIIKAQNKYVDNEKLSDIYLWSDKSKVMFCDSKEDTYKSTEIRVWDKRRLKVMQQKYTEGVLELDYKFPQGWYLVDILIDDVWVENIPLEVK